MERAVSTNPMCESTGKSLLTIRVEHVPKGSESFQPNIGKCLSFVKWGIAFTFS
jgi:hypothetical protein